MGINRKRVDSARWQDLGLAPTSPKAKDLCLGPGCQSIILPTGPIWQHRTMCSNLSVSLDRAQSVQKERAMGLQRFRRGAIAAFAMLVGLIVSSFAESQHD